MTGIFPPGAWVVIAAVFATSVLVFRLVPYFGLESVHPRGDSEDFSTINALALAGILAIQREYRGLQNRTITFRL